MKMRVDALTSKSFEGVLYFKGEPWDYYLELMIRNGVFVGNEFSAEAILRTYIRGRLYVVYQTTMTGIVENEKMNLSIDLNRYLIPDGSTDWVLTRK